MASELEKKQKEVESTTKELNEIRKSFKESEAKKKKTEKVLEHEEQELEDAQKELEACEKHVMEHGGAGAPAASPVVLRPATSRPFLFPSRIWAIEEGGPSVIRGVLHISLSPLLPFSLPLIDQHLLSLSPLLPFSLLLIDQHLTTL
jgi:hypothetical protein